jgi:hypothetical protein
MCYTKGVMTICIAALYENGKGFVLASDLMTTAHFPIGYEFEREDVEKIIKLTESPETYALIAGDVLFANATIEKAQEQAKAQGKNTVEDLAELIRLSYQDIRRERVVRGELEPRGLNINSYYQNHQKLLSNIVQMIDRQFVSYNPGVELIITGGGKIGCHIFTISNPGQCLCLDAIGYAAIGTGAPHAIYSLIDSKYVKSLSKDKVVELVNKAKKRSQVAPGVGTKTKSISI